jgi:hypothetical protein
MFDSTTIAICSASIALLSLAISAMTLWYTHLRRGQLAMTKPTVVFFGYDSVPRLTPKIFLRTLLYSTSAKGKVVEGMYVKLCRGRSERIFSFWGYGETNKLTPGSGLYVGQTGVSLNHHFVLSVHNPDYAFVAGTYIVRVFARLVGRSSPIQLTEFQITLSEHHAAVLAQNDGVLFELGPDDQGYLGHTYQRT